METAQAGGEQVLNEQVLNQKVLAVTSAPTRNVGKIVVRFVVLLASSVALMAFVWSR